MAKGLRVMTFLLATALLSATRAHALPQTEIDLPSAPGAAIGTALLNVVYVPLRFAVTAVGVNASGLTGWLLGGDKDAAEDVWSLVRGPAYLTPAMLQGRESFRFGQWESQR